MVPLSPRFATFCFTIHFRFAAIDVICGLGSFPKWLIILSSDSWTPQQAHRILEKSSTKDSVSRVLMMGKGLSGRASKSVVRPKTIGCDVWFFQDLYPIFTTGLFDDHPPLLVCWIYNWPPLWNHHQVRTRLFQPPFSLGFPKIQNVKTPHVEMIPSQIFRWFPGLSNCPLVN